MKKKFFIRNYLISFLLVFSLFGGLILSNVKIQYDQNSQFLTMEKNQSSIRQKKIIDTLLYYSSVYAMQKETGTNEENLFVWKFLTKKMDHNLAKNNNNQADEKLYLGAEYLPNNEAEFKDLQTVQPVAENPINLLRNPKYKKMLDYLFSQEKNSSYLSQIKQLFAFFKKEEIYPLLKKDEANVEGISNLLLKLKKIFSPETTKNQLLPVLKKIDALPWNLIYDILLTVGIPFYNENFFTGTEKTFFQESEIFRWIKFSEIFLNYELENTSVEIIIDNNNNKQEISLSTILEWVKNQHVSDPTVSRPSIYNVLDSAPIVKNQIIKSIMKKAGFELVTNFLSNFLNHPQEKKKLGLPANILEWFKNNKNNSQLFFSLFNFIKIMLFIGPNATETTTESSDNFLVNYLQNFLKILDVDFKSEEAGYLLEGIQEGILSEAESTQPTSKIWQVVASNIDLNTFHYLVDVLTEQFELLKNKINNENINLILKVINLLDINVESLKQLIFDKTKWTSFIDKMTNSFHERLNDLEIKTNQLIQNKSKSNYLEYYESFDQFLNFTFDLTEFIIEEILTAFNDEINISPRTTFMIIKKIMIYSGVTEEFYQQGFFNLIDILIENINFSKLNQLLKETNVLMKDFKKVIMAFLKATASEQVFSGETLLSVFFAKLTGDLNNLDAAELNANNQLEIHENSFYSQNFDLFAASMLNLEKTNEDKNLFFEYLSELLNSETSGFSSLTKKTTEEINNKFYSYLNPNNWIYKDLKMDSEILETKNKIQTNAQNEVSFTAIFKKNGYILMKYNFVWKINIYTSRAELFSWERLNLT